MNSDQRQLLAVHFNSKEKRLTFHYRAGRWDVLESLRPRSIREALRTGAQRIEDSKPGALIRAAASDSKNYELMRQRRRRYVAAERDDLYRYSPHLKKQSEAVAGHWVVTNIPWRDVHAVLHLVCVSNDIRYGPPAI